MDEKCVRRKKMQRVEREQVTRMSFLIKFKQQNTHTAIKRGEKTHTNKHKHTQAHHTQSFVFSHLCVPSKAFLRNMIATTNTNSVNKIRVAF